MNIYFLVIPEIMVLHPGISIRKEDADRTVAYLLAGNLVEKRLRIYQDGNSVYIPVTVTAGSRIGDMKVFRYEFSSRITEWNPYNEILGNLEKRGIDLSTVPRKWITYGDSVIIRFPEGAVKKKVIAEAFMEVLKCRSVYEVRGGVRGQDRIPSVTLSAGKGGEIRHLENGVIYVFDPEKIMYSPGNVNERHHFLKLVKKGDTVIDMFSGIGYFSLQVARHTDAARIHCIDINPEAIKFLKKSASINRLDQTIYASVGDCRIMDQEIKADLIFMGNFSSIDYIAHGVRRLKPGGGIIAHFIVSSEEIETCGNRIIQIIQRLGMRCSVEDLHRVKSYAPNLWHMSAFINIWSSEDIVA